MKQIAIYSVAAAAALTAIARLGKHVEILFPHCPKSLWITLAFLPLLVAVLLSLFRTGWQISSGSATTGYFKVMPYGDTPTDQANFDRADLAHKQIKDWLATTKDSIVYLTAVSGAGKSSLLNAYVIPQLRNSGAMVSITVRSFDDPLAAVHSRLLTQGQVWEKPPMGTNDVRQLLEKAADHLGKRRLLIIFDQFEEFLLMLERKPSSMQATQDFLSSLVKHPIAGMTVLIVMRSDYVGMLHDFVKCASLPEINYSHWRTISAFRERDARAFLEKSGLDIEPNLEDEVFKQIRMVEESDGLVRPITLNMVGMILDRYSVSRKRILRKASREGLISGYIRNCLGHSNVGKHCRQILRRMITLEGRREPRPRTVEAISNETKIAEGGVFACLKHLEFDGIVRSLDLEQSTWEISHDFVAKVVERVLATWRKNVWEKINQWAFPVSVALWLGLFVTLPWVYHTLRGTLMSEVTVRIKFSANDSGHADVPPGFGSGTLTIHASLKSKTNAADTLNLEFYRDQAVEAGFPPGDKGEEYANATAVFSPIRGHLGAFRNRALWQSAILGGELTWLGNCEWNSDQAPAFDSSLDVIVDGEVVATIPGVPIIVDDSHFHNAPCTYHLQFPERQNEAVSAESATGK
jgi:hypothetical protein